MNITDISQDMKRVLLIIIILSVLSLHNPSSSQVINDDIENALALNINEVPYLSNTTNCTVQWACVNEALTGKCIKYHNDQWFTLTTGNPGVYYINIANQNCRDVLGVQLVIIDGIPCDTSTYNTIACVSLANQDDIFVKMDSLKGQHTYLLNVDGYLHDFCGFTIQVSTKASGMPVQLEQGYIVALNVENEDKFVDLSWTVSDKIARKIHRYHISRYYAGAKKSEKIASISHQINARGQSKLEYTFKDTLTTDGKYEYKIIGETLQGQKFLLGFKAINYDAKSETLSLPLDFKNNTPLTVVIIDAISNKILARDSFLSNKNNLVLFYPVDSYLSQGIRQFKVFIINRANNKKEQYLFDKR